MTKVVMNACYILWSESLDKFYVGATHESVNERLVKHNSGHYSGKSFTSQVSDWETFLIIETEDYAHALRLERKIKSMKSSKYIRNLRKYEELVDKIKIQTST
ncbi:MAG: putative endonuclease [Spirosomataceae bacterium]|jgi:putative endonuclease